MANTSEIQKSELSKLQEDDTDDDERYCDNEDCPYGSYICFEKKAEMEGKEYICDKCSDCGRTEEELDANDVELTGEGKYARCLDCEDERFSHMEDACEECGDRVGRHAANVGIIGMKICFDCDAHGAYAEATENE